MEAGEGPQRDQHGQAQDHGQPSGMRLFVVFDPFQKRIHHDYILPFHLLQDQNIVAVILMPLCNPNHNTFVKFFQHFFILQSHYNL
jgi:hypothetical protein